MGIFPMKPNLDRQREYYEDIRKKNIPDRLDPQTNKIHCKTFKVYRIDIYFKGSEIRRGIG